MEQEMKVAVWTGDNFEYADSQFVAAEVPTLAREGKLLTICVYNADGSIKQVDTYSDKRLLMSFTPKSAIFLRQKDVIDMLRPDAQPV